MTFKEFYYKYMREVWLVFATLVWTIPYFFINKYSVGRTEMGLNTYLDSLLPALPFTVLIYVSSFVMVFMPYLFVKEKERFKAVAKSYLVAMVIGYLTFLILPIKVVRSEIVNTDIFSRMLQTLYAYDFPYNSFPSLHVAMSMLGALIINHENKKWGKWMLLWAVLIAVSTLTTKQHTLMDVMGGLAVSMFAYWVYLKLIRKNKLLQQKDNYR